MKNPVGYASIRLMSELCENDRTRIIVETELYFDNIFFCFLRTEKCYCVPTLTYAREVWNYVVNRMPTC